MQTPSKQLKNYSTSEQCITLTAKDCISELPDHILGDIFKYLALRDICKIRILSHRWKNIYLALFDLKFSWINVFDNSSKTLKKPCRGFQNKFASAVNQFLDFYPSQGILRSFQVYFCLGHEYSDFIDRWVSFAIGMDVKLLCLNLFCDKCCYRNEEKDMYIFRSKLFEGTKTNLKHLTLIGCVLGPNFTNQFSSLESLYLSCVPLAQYDLQSMFSYLMNLKHIKLIQCTLPAKICLNSLHLLVTFYLFKCSGVMKIVLSNLNLKIFSCLCTQVVVTNADKVPNLKHLEQNCGAKGLHYVFTHLSKRLRMLNTLHISSTCDWVKYIPKSIVGFNRITLLNLCFTGSSRFDLFKMISIVGAFPSLQRLILTMNCRGDSEQEKLEPIEHVHKHLKKVEISVSYDMTANQIEFAIYLLQRSLALKSLVINYHVEPHICTGNKDGPCSSLVINYYVEPHKESPCSVEILRLKLREQLQKSSKGAEVIVK